MPLVAVLVFWVLLGVNGVNGDHSLNLFFNDIITKFRLTSPTLIYQGVVPEICMTHQWLLCLDQEDEQDILPDVYGNDTNFGKLIKSALRLTLSV